jgi:hypothetical protein
MMTYHEKYYGSSFKEHPGEIFVSKKSQSNWLDITLEVHGEQRANIELVSKNMVEGLIFMLQQVLKR